MGDTLVGRKTNTVSAESDGWQGRDIGDRLSNTGWLLDRRKVAEYDPDNGIRYNWLVLTFHSGAGRAAPFCVGRCDPFGNVNPLTYDGFATLPYAMFNYTYERG